jgi:hypothetical protein
MDKKALSKKLPFLEQFRHLKEYLILAGIKKEPKKIFMTLIMVAGAIDILILSIIIKKLLEFRAMFAFVLIISLLMLTLGLASLFIIVWLVFLFMLDYLKFKRKTELETILPEFLRLVSANHRAGITMEMSLWKANRPRFGVLSEEINEVAKNTFAEGNLVGPLQKFAAKYDSNMLRRVVSNMVEGIKTGADMSSLLDDISANITTIKTTRKEMASEVENYMLFISLTVLVISPLMFSLSHKMTGVIESVKSTLAETLMGEEETAMPLPLELKVSTGKRDFRYYFDVFVYLMITTNSLVSVMLMSLVKYGNVKQELKRIPVFFIIGTLLYMIFKLAFKNFLVM